MKEILCRNPECRKPLTLPEELFRARYQREELKTPESQVVVIKCKDCGWETEVTMKAKIT